MSAWGGHRNGQIPLSSLEYVGRGAISGAPQYLHSSAAAAWRGFVAEVRNRFGVTMTITEGYRNLALQQHYWNLWQSGQGNPAARPGTSNHGWATAVDMANYFSVPVAERRAIGQSYGFSFATGDSVREPWHIEFVGSLSQAGGGGTPIDPTPPKDKEESMYIVNIAGGGGIRLFTPLGSVQIGSPYHVSLILRILEAEPGKAEINAAEADIVRSYIHAAATYDDQLQKDLLDALGRISVEVDPEPIVQAVKDAVSSSLAEQGVDIDLTSVMEAIDAIPDKVVNNLRDRL